MLVKRLSEHTKVVHPTGEQFQCEKCGRQYAVKDKLTRHKVVCQKVGGLVCVDCPDGAPKYEVNVRLWRHIMRDHPLVKVFFCDPCRRPVGTTEEQMQAHSKRVHEKLRKCPKCAAIVKSVDIEQHFSSCMSSDERSKWIKKKTAKCNTCGEVFHGNLASRKLAKHQRKAHGRRRLNI